MVRVVRTPRIEGEIVESGIYNGEVLSNVYYEERESRKKKRKKRLRQREKAERVYRSAPIDIGEDLT